MPRIKPDIPNKDIGSQSETILTIILILTAFIVRLITLGRADLWQDEAILVGIMANPSLTIGEVATSYWQIIISMAQLPLAGVVQSAWMFILKPWFGDSVIYQNFWLRIPMVMAGTISVWGVLLTARMLLNRSVAWCAALMCAFFLYPIYYSREVYCYAYIMLFSSFGTYFWLKAVSGDHYRDSVGFMFCMMGIAFSHLGGVIFLCSILLVTGIGWLWGLICHDTKIVNRQFRAGLFGGIALLAVLPYFLHFVLHNKAHTQSSIHVPISTILNDSLSKMFLGDRPLFSIMAWTFFVSGLLYVFRYKRLLFQARMYVAICIIGYLMLALATSRSQYISARYLSPLMPVIYTIVAAGICLFAGLWSRPFIRSIFPFIVTGICICIHLIAYLPSYYCLKSKSVDFGAIAQWLNENLAHGNPYLMESAYELRFVGGYFKTPGKVGAAPYVHGGGQDEIQRLHERQMRFMEQFPESPFIESAHHGYDKPEGVWKFPHQHHARHIQLRNEPLRNLIKLGIYPGMPKEEITDIYYSEFEDIVQHAAAKGAYVIFQWSDWGCLPYEQHPQGIWANYARFRPAHEGIIEIVSLKPDDVSGKIMLQMALAGDASEKLLVTLHNGNTVIAEGLVYAGRFFNLESEVVIVPPEGMKLLVRVEKKALTRFRGMLLRDAVFQPWSDQ